MRNLMLTLGLSAALVVSSAPDLVSAHTHHYRHRVYHACAAQRHRNGAIGAVAGMVGGAIIGSSITHGRAGGTLLGAGAGAFTGHAIAKGTTRC